MSTDPSIPPKDGRCLFFTLARELRNIIYEYALTEEWGLASHKREPYSKFVTARGPPSGAGEDETFKNWGDDRLAESSAMESNQLEYVCRQLHQETSGLGLKFNALTFYSTEKICALRHFDSFIQECSTTQQRHITKITVVQDNVHNSWVWYENFAFESLTGYGVAAPLYNFCLTRPDVQAVVRFNWRLDSPPLRMTLGIHLACRGTVNPNLKNLWTYSNYRMEGLLSVDLPTDVEWNYRGDACIIYHHARNGKEDRVKIPLENLRLSVVPFWDQTMWFLENWCSVNPPTQECIAQVRKLFEEGV